MYRGLFTAGWFGLREKHCFRLEIYDRLRASEQADDVVCCGLCLVMVALCSRRTLTFFFCRENTLS